MYSEMCLFSCYLLFEIAIEKCFLVHTCNLQHCIQLFGVFYFCGTWSALTSLQVNISLSRTVPHREVQRLLSQVLSDPTTHCQKSWHLLLVFHSLSCIIFLLFFSLSFICFFSLSSRCSYYLQSHRFSAAVFFVFYVSLVASLTPSQYFQASLSGVAFPLINEFPV